MTPQEAAQMEPLESDVPFFAKVFLLLVDHNTSQMCGGNKGESVR